MNIAKHTFSIDDDLKPVYPVTITRISNLDTGSKFLYALNDYMNGKTTFRVVDYSRDMMIPNNTEDFAFLADAVEYYNSIEV